MIHIKELFRLQDIQHLRLIAGRDGLERTVTAAVLFEYDPSRVQLPDFYRGDLVVTTLAYARGDAQLVAHSLQALMNQGIASLMVKTAYFSELPQSVIALANRLGTPVFLFDDTYIEEVILQVTDLIRGKRHFSGFEQDVDALMRGDLTEEQTRERARRIDPVGHGRYRLYAVNPKERVVSLDDRLYALLETDADAARRVRVCLQQRVEPVVQRNHALLGVDGIQPIAPVPDRVDAPRALPRLLLGQVAAHQRVNVLLEAGKMPLAADEVGHLQNDLLNVCVVKEKHGRAQPVGQRDHRLRQLAEIRRFHHQARDALIHQRLKGVRHELRVAARVSQRGHDQIAAVKIRKLHAGWVVFKQNGRRHGALQSVPTGDQAQMLNVLKPKQLFNVNQARSPPALFCG